MKRNLLKTMLAAVALALPIGAWADETVISSATTWTFGDYAVSDAVTTGINEITVGSSNSGLYNRSATSGRGFKWQTSDISSVTFMDGTEASVSMMALKPNGQKVDSNDMTNLTAAQTTVDSEDKKNSCTAFFTFNTSVAGTCYAFVKNGTSGKARIYFGKGDGTATTNVETEATDLTEIQLTAVSGGTFFIGGIVKDADCYIYAIRFIPLQESICTATSLSFDHFKTSSTLSQVINTGHGFYMRGTNSNNRYFTLTDNTDESKPYTFADGTSLAADKFIELNTAIGANAFTNDNDQTPWTTSGGTTYPAIAFKNSVAGKVCVIAAKTSTSTATLRYYYKSNSSTATNVSVTTTPTEYTWDVAANEVTYITAGTAAGLRIFGVRFIPNTYTLTINAENGTVARYPEKTKYDYNDEVTLTATPAEGYKFVSWTGVDTEEGATATVTMSDDKEVTATFARASMSTVWTFEQYVPGVNMFGTSTSKDAIEYADGLYLHTRDADADGYKITSADFTISNNLAADIVSQTRTYKRGGAYSAINIQQGIQDDIRASTGSGELNVDTKANCNGISYKAPAAGTFYATFYSEQKVNLYIFKNKFLKSELTDDDKKTIGRDSDPKMGGGTISVTVAQDDVIYIVSDAGGDKKVYLLEVMFKPTAADAANKTIEISSAGYATFSAMQNYTLPTELKAYVVSNVSETTATMTEVSMIPGGTGVILSGEPGEYTLTSTESVTPVGDNYLRANLKAYELPADDGTNYNYTLAAGPTFKHSSGSGTLTAGKAFLRTTVNATSTPAPVLNIAFGGSATGIEKVAVEQQANGVYYNLAGQRVAQPTKGLYIVNGKKVVIK